MAQLEIKYKAFGPDIYQYIFKIVLLTNSDLERVLLKIFPNASKEELTPVINSLNKEKVEKIKFASLIEAFAVESSYQLNEFEGRNKVIDLLN